MGVEALDWALSQKTGSGSTKLVLLIISNRANENGECFSDMDGIADQSNMSKRSVVTAIQKLADSGFISVTRRGGNGSGSKSNVYQINMEQSANTVKQSAKSSLGDAPPSLNKSAWGDYLSHRSEIRAKRLTPRGQQMAMKGLAKLSHDDQQRTVDLTISNGWQGLFPEKIQNEKTRPGNARPKTVEEIHAGLRAKAGLE